MVWVVHRSPLRNLIRVLFFKTFDKGVNDPVKENVPLNDVPEVDSAKEVSKARMEVHVPNDLDNKAHPQDNALSQEDVEEGTQASPVMPSHISDKSGDDAQVVSSDDDSFWGFKSS